MRFREYNTRHSSINQSPPTEYVLTPSNAPGSKKRLLLVQSLSKKFSNRGQGDTVHDDTVKNINGVCSRVRGQFTQLCSDLFLPVGYVLVLVYSSFIVYLIQQFH